MRFYIDDKDAWTRWGAELGDGSLPKILSAPNGKKISSTEWSEHDYSEVYLGEERKVDTRQVSFTLALTDQRSAEEIAEEIRRAYIGNIHEFRLVFADGAEYSFRGRMQQVQSLKAKRDAGVVGVTVVCDGWREEMEELNNGGVEAVGYLPPYTVWRQKYGVHERTTLGAMGWMVVNGTEEGLRSGQTARERLKSASQWEDGLAFYDTVPDHLYKGRDITIKLWQSAEPREALRRLARLFLFFAGRGRIRFDAQSGTGYCGYYKSLTVKKAQVVDEGWRLWTEAELKMTVTETIDTREEANPLLAFREQDADAWRVFGFDDGAGTDGIQIKG